jgi:fructokinase
MADVFADADEAFCRRFGVTLPVQHVPAETMAAILAAVSAAASATLPASAVYASGGGAANTAKIAARLGLKAAFFGCIGAEKTGGRADRFGGFFEKELAKAGVSAALRLGKQPTGVFLCLTVNGEKRIAASPSAARELRAEDLPDPVLIRTQLNPLKKPRFQKPGAFLFEGFLLENNDVKKRCLDIAGSSGLVPAFDPCTVSIAETYAEEILSWLEQYRLVLFVNEREAEALARRAYGGAAYGGAARGWEALFKDLTAKGGSAAVKLAEKGAAIFSDGGFYRAETRPVKTAETTGAGDAVAAGFLAALLRGKTPDQCGREGNRAARRFLERKIR